MKKPIKKECSGAGHTGAKDKNTHRQAVFSMPIISHRARGAK